MGGCCCCFSSQEPVLNNEPAYLHQEASDDHVPISSQLVNSTPAVSTGLFVDTNLNTSVPNAPRPPPVPIPFNIVLRCPATPQRTQVTSHDKNDGTAQTINSTSGNDMKDANPQETSAKGEDDKDKTNKELDSVKKDDVELLKSVETAEEDACPTCLDEYDEENPKITSKCGHGFHLACILEWKERKDTCPMCDKVMLFDPPID